MRLIFWPSVVFQFLLTVCTSVRPPGIGNPLAAAMLWLMIGLLVSVGALLFVAAGVARHIWLQRAELRKGTRGGNKSNDSADDADSELEL
jgi:hypothetical protein